MTDRELFAQAVVALEYHTQQTRSISNTNLAIEALRTRLAQPELEPVACDCDSPAWCKQYKKCHRAMLGFKPYVAPPQREWQGLTDEELLDIADMAYANDLELLQTLQAKLKEKNHG